MTAPTSPRRRSRKRSLAHPAVESAGVIGLHDLLHGENVRAYVALKPGVTRPKALDLIQFAQVARRL